MDYLRGFKSVLGGQEEGKGEGPTGAETVSTMLYLLSLKKLCFLY